MNFEEYTIVDIYQAVPDVFIIHVKPTRASSVFSFKPGQFCQIKNPDCIKPNEMHVYSIASSPQVINRLEFCVKAYGPWTKKLTEKKIGEHLFIYGPLGRFFWDEKISNAVFLAVNYVKT